MIRTNSLFRTDIEAFSCEIEDADGVVLYTKKFNLFQNAEDWCLGMLKEEINGAYRILDTDTKKCLCDGRKLAGDFVSYSNYPAPPVVATPGGNAGSAVDPGNAELEKGISTEMEHRDMIVHLLLQAHPDLSGEDLERRVKEVAAEIARVHIKEDGQYYEKLEKMEG